MTTAHQKAFMAKSVVKRRPRMIERPKVLMTMSTVSGVLRRRLT